MTPAQLAAEAATQAHCDRLNDALEKAIDGICRRAGGINDDPSPREVRDMLARHGLIVCLRDAT